MSDPTFSDAELMAYADGELEEARATEIDLALAADSALARRLAIFVETRATVSDAFTPMLDEPLPGALLQNIQKLARDSDSAQPEQPEAEHNTVIAFGSSHGRRASHHRPVWQIAIAASLTLAIGLGVGLYLGAGPFSGSGKLTGGLQIAALNDPDIIDALSIIPAGERRVLDSGSEITIIATFLDDAGAVCREFEYDRPKSSTLVAVTCYDSKWNVKFAVAAAPSSDTGYAPASSLATLDAYLRAIGAQEPLSVEGEAKALATLVQSAD